MKTKTEKAIFVIIVLIGVVSIFRDVTETKPKEKPLNVQINTKKPTIHNDYAMAYSYCINLRKNEK